MQTQIRLATELDIPAITQLINRAFSVESFFKRGDRIDEAQTRAKLASGSIYVAHMDGVLYGCVYIDVAASDLPHVLADGSGAGYLGMLSVDPEQQGRGLGSQLMHFAEEELRRRGCDKHGACGGPCRTPRRWSRSSCRRATAPSFWVPALTAC